LTGQREIKIHFSGKITGEEIRLFLQMDSGSMEGSFESILKRVKVAAPLPATDNRAIADATFDEFLNRDYSALAKRFSPEMRAATTSEKLSKSVSPVLGSLGRLRTDRPEPNIIRRQGYDVFLYPAEFTMARMTVVISINSAGQVTGLFLRPPQPESAKPGELVVTSGDIKLPATLVVPEGKGPFPAVVFVHGSGPNDRDETIGPNAPFRDLAEGLAKHGVASLRYVKRTRQYPRAVATVKDEVIDDALNALILAKSQPNIGPRRVFLLGHSMGAYLAPRIANAGVTIAGIIMLAGNVRPIMELARDQLVYLKAPPENLQQLKAAAPASYWEDLKTYDPVASARQLSMPILILQGERDYQVTMKEFNLWKSGLQGHGNVTFKSYPKLNHLFLEGEGKSLPAEYMKPGHIPDYVYADIADFINHISQSRKE
jgi:dienelactone hydrolase